MLSIVSCILWPLAHLLWRNVYLYLRAFFTHFIHSLVYSSISISRAPMMCQVSLYVLSYNDDKTNRQKTTKQKRAANLNLFIILTLEGLSRERNKVMSINPQQRMEAQSAPPCISSPHFQDVHTLPLLFLHSLCRLLSPPCPAFFLYCVNFSSWCISVPGPPCLQGPGGGFPPLLQLFFWNIRTHFQNTKCSLLTLPWNHCMSKPRWNLYEESRHFTTTAFFLIPDTRIRNLWWSKRYVEAGNRRELKYLQGRWMRRVNGSNGALTLSHEQLAKMQATIHQLLETSSSGVGLSAVAKQVFLCP